MPIFSRFSRAAAQFARSLFLEALMALPTNAGTVAMQSLFVNTVALVAKVPVGPGEENARNALKRDARRIRTRRPDLIRR